MRKVPIHTGDSITDIQCRHELQKKKKKSSNYGFKIKLNRDLLIFNIFAWWQCVILCQFEVNFLVVRRCKRWFWLNSLKCILGDDTNHYSLLIGSSLFWTFETYFKCLYFHLGKIDSRRQALYRASTSPVCTFFTSFWQWWARVPWAILMPLISNQESRVVCTFFMS